MTWRTDSPDWSDSGKRVEGIDAHGAAVVGTLEIEDWHFDGEEEWPIHVLRLDDGTLYESFYSLEKWRVI